MHICVFFCPYSKFTVATHYLTINHFKNIFAKILLISIKLVAIIAQTRNNSLLSLSMVLLMSEKLAFSWILLQFQCHVASLLILSFKFHSSTCFLLLPSANGVAEMWCFHKRVSRILSTREVREVYIPLCRPLRADIPWQTYRQTPPSGYFSGR